MADSYYILTKVDDQSPKRIKLWDNGDGTFSTNERRAVDVSEQLARVDEGVRARWPTLRDGIPFVLPGHPDIVTQSHEVVRGDSETNTAIIDCPEGMAIVVTKLVVITDNSVSADVAVTIGFGLTFTPAGGAQQVLYYNPGMARGQKHTDGSGAGTIGVGAAGEDLRITCDVIPNGELSILVTYFTVLCGVGGSPSLSPSASASPSASESPSLSASFSPSLSPSASASPSESPSLSPSASASPSESQSAGPSA